MLFLSGCLRVADTGPRFSDIQRAPPPVSPETADYLVRAERPFTEWLVETATNCARLGCAD